MPSTSSQRAIWITAACVAVDAFLWGAWLVAMLVFIPQAMRTFQNFYVKVPVFTEFYLATERWIENYFYILAVWMVFFLAVDGVIDFLLRRRSQTRALAWCWALLMVVLPLLALLGLGIAVVVPLGKLYEGLSK